MAPKRQVEKVEAKQVLTAVLLADSFTQVSLKQQQRALENICTIRHQQRSSQFSSYPRRLVH
jgi:hypothetical protein